MEIMLSHFGIGMAYDALDGLDVHAQRLHLRHIGVAAAVRREQADIARFFQRFAEHIPEMGGIAGQAGLGAFPDELIGGIPPAKPMVPMLLCSPSLASGISSSTTT